ncbi:hypothetical protein PYCCODRAFT_167459 [Trametes coccinea BRFM310]|uniref:Uncharacterized protein n=1 Tax=Trametes coccinea (strain BRFM310) TaxID=1353009 RepID=A0A1Y2IUV9_TRAC3|nr:hypothetical protein PYCCODRAFT_167459 [Trametes coccinea BRFM310]
MILLRTTFAAIGSIDGVLEREETLRTPLTRDFRVPRTTAFAILALGFSWLRPASSDLRLQPSYFTASAVSIYGLSWTRDSHTSCLA